MELAKYLVAFLLLKGIFIVNGEQAQACDRFVDSVGVNAHWDYPNTPYGFNASVVVNALIASGIRHIRCAPDIGGDKPYVNDILQILFNSGIKCTMVMEPITTLNFYANFTKSMNSLGTSPYIVAWEGPNEPDLFWVNSGRMYNGQAYPQGVFNWQKDLFNYAKGDNQLKAITIVGPSSGITYDPGAGHFNPLCDYDMDSVVDWGNFHPYPGGNPFSYPFSYAGLEKYYWQSDFPSINLDQYPQAFAVGALPYNRSKTKIMATETGYSTNYPGGGTPISSHMKYIPRLFLEYFRLGVQRTLLYEFIDEFNNTADRESNFGLLNWNCTQKPGLTALTSLLKLLDDSPDHSKPIVDTSFVPGSLNFSAEVTPIGNFTMTYFVHHLLLQKKNGDFYLALWHEITADDNSQSPQLLVQSPQLPVNITMANNTKNPFSVTIYKYNSVNSLVGAAYTKYNDSTNPTILVNATDTVTVILLSYSVPSTSSTTKTGTTSTTATTPSPTTSSTPSPSPSPSSSSTSETTSSPSSGSSITWNLWPVFTIFTLFVIYY